VVDAAAATTPSWGAATRTCPGETVAGDLVCVRRTDAGTLFAVVDGAGHGAPAAWAATVARDVLVRMAGREPTAILAASHEALKPTRGAAISLAFVPRTGRTLSWTGVGDVMGTLLAADGHGVRPRASLRTSAGVAGHLLPEADASTVALGHGDVLILATDGVDGAFADSLRLSGRPEDVADRVIGGHWTGTDDAAVLVVRFVEVTA
jgi:negative regulator of sigma-B (phosphoserine phosphatase)